METILYYFGFEPERLGGKRKVVFDYLKRMLCPLGSAKLVAIQVDMSDPKIFTFDHIIIFPAVELKDTREIQQLSSDVVATSFCVLSPGDHFIATIVGP